MDLREALDVVLSLAQENCLTEADVGENGPGLCDEMLRQEQAINKVHQLLSLLSES